MNWYEVTYRRPRWNIVFTECYRSCDSEGAKQQCFRGMQADDEIIAVRQLVPIVDIQAAALRFVAQKVEAKPVEPLLEALRRIQHQAVAGLGTLDEFYRSVGVGDFQLIEKIAREALAAADTPVPDPEAVVLKDGSQGMYCGRCGAYLVVGETVYLDSETWNIYCSRPCRGSARKIREGSD